LLAIVASTAFPQIATVSPLYLLMRALELRDTWAGLVLVHASFALPLTIWLLAGFVREIPIEAEEAASVDGAGLVSMFRWVLIPLLAPGLASTALLTFLFSWNEFLFAYTFTVSEASRTIPVALALFPGVFEVPWGDIAAASMLASLPPVVIVIALQRFLVRGLVAFWGIFVIFATMGIDALAIPGAAGATSMLLRLLPRLLSALLILVVGWLAANFVGQAVLITAVNAGILQARLLARATRWVVL